MPGIIVHDLFAKDMYGELFESIGGSRDEAEAFLLGNQGPDPLFFVEADPRYRAYRGLASALHRSRPAELLYGFKKAVREMPTDKRSIGRAYTLGMASHYSLDSTLHPFIISQVKAYTQAGVEGLNPSHESEVHSAIETELDELALTQKRGETVAHFSPATAILKGRPEMIEAISHLYVDALNDALDLTVPSNLFKSALGYNRAVQAALYSPTGAKRKLLGKVERLVRDHSMAAALSHRAYERTTSVFANEERKMWNHPFTDAVSREGFWDLYKTAQERARTIIAAMDDDSFNRESSHAITGDINFYGEPIVAVVMAIEDVNGKASDGD